MNLRSEIIVRTSPYVNAIAVTAVFVLCMPCAVFCQHISIATQKNAYKTGEQVVLTINNVSSAGVFTVAASSRPEMGLTNIEKKASVGWDALPLRCRQPSCTVDYTIPEPAEIKAGASFSFRWQPKIFLDNTYVNPEPGLYRVTIMYRVKKETDPSAWNWTTVRSNVFTLE
ncbi:MAG: hypothetical protein KBC23_03590 [Candidatus Omnitrophica bacterium]|nr:hypothetical protein [Candidatus Omnitrophota bacterium]